MTTIHPPILITPPATEPVTLEEALNQCHAEAGVEDAWFAAQIRAGRQRVETFIKRSLMKQVWALRVEGAIPQRIDLPRSPVLGLVSIKHQANVAADPVDIGLDAATLVNEAVPAQLHRCSWPARGILRIEYRAGYPARERIPQDIKHAILLFVSHGYENRAGERDLPAAFYNLIEPYRLYLGD